MFFKRQNMFAEAFHSIVKGIHLALEVKTSFGNSTPAMGFSIGSSTQKPGLPTDSHHGARRWTLHRLRADFFVPGAWTIIWNFVRGCVTCQKNKTEHLHPAGLLQHLGVPSAIWADISMDFIEGFHKINGKSVILTVVDRFSKAAHFITLSHPYTATIVAHAFFTEIVRLHGIPSSIVSDHDPTLPATSGRNCSSCRVYAYRCHRPSTLSLTDKRR
jgi:hypothetical protein